jgi:uncharacterized protein
MRTVDKTGIVKMGWRSKPSFSRIPLAGSMGGGGHAQARGFKMDGKCLIGLLTGVFGGAQ